MAIDVGSILNLVRIPDHILSESEAKALTYSLINIKNDLRWDHICAYLWISVIHIQK